MKNYKLRPLFNFAIKIIVMRLQLHGVDNSGTTHEQKNKEFIASIHNSLLVRTICRKMETNPDKEN